MYRQRPYLYNVNSEKTPPNHNNDMQMPLLGKMTNEEIIESVHKAIVGEATAINFYSRLLQEACDETNREFINEALEDEMKHLHYFEQLYYMLTGNYPQYTIEPVQYDNYKDALLFALKDELKAADFYRDMQLSVTNQKIKDTFYLAMTDELGHATMFSTLYNRL